MKRMVCKISCERPDCGFEEEVPAKKVFGRLFREPSIPKDWGFVFAPEPVTRNLLMMDKPLLLCPKCFNEAKKVYSEFLNSKKSLKDKKKAEKKIK